MIAVDDALEARGVTRQTRTVLFTDIEGSTRLRTTRGDDAGDLVVALHDEVVARAVADHHGTVVKGTGDGYLALFASARAAVAAAVTVQRDLARRRRDADGVALRVRIGINAGEVRDQHGDVLGEAVNAAARILAVADADEILVSRVVRDLMGTTEVTFTDRGDHDLKGFPEPWRLYDVQWTDDEVESPLLRIRLLGQVTVDVDGVALPAFESARLQHVLARLVTTAGRRVTRVQLAFELWPGSTEQQARTNLRKVLHDLRQALPDAGRYLDIDGQSICWRLDAPASVDVVEFHDALRADRLDAAADVYAGDFMPGFYEDWVLSERERLRTFALDARSRLAVDAEARGDVDGALAQARSLLGLDALREDGYRLLMRCHARRGERAEGLRAYHKCVEVLDRELGVEPDSATRAAYLELRPGPSAADDQPAPVRPVGPSATLVGRDDEWAQAVDAWGVASSGRATLLLVSGEPGIGKSRLVDDLAHFVGASGGVVARARSYQSAGRVPWGPVVDWLRDDNLRPGVARLTGGRAGELSRLLPELRVGLVEPRSSGGAESSGRHELFDAIAAALHDDGRPTLLALDDLQWCDADTIDVVGYLLHIRDAPLLIAATARTEEMDDAHPARVLVAALVREGSAFELPLEPLDVDATTQLASRLSGGALREDDARRLWEETEGNPLFVVEALRAGARAPGESATTPTVQAVIGARLAQLSANARSVAETAAVLGRMFRVDVLAHAMSVDEDDLIDALDELWGRRIIRDLADGYDFTHDRLREVALHGTSPARRRKLHRCAADALAAVHGSEAGPVSARLAPHYEEAGRYAEAVDAHRRAAEYALEVFAIDDAIASLRRALGLLEHLPAGRGRDEIELGLRVAVGAPMVARDGYGSAAVSQTYERALNLCGRLGVRIDPAVLRGLGLASLVVCRFDRSTRFAQALLDQADDEVAVVEGLYLMGVCEFWRGRFGESSAHLRRAIAEYRPQSSAKHRTHFAQDPKGVCLSRLAFTTLWTGDADGARALADEARGFADSIQHPPTLGYVLAWSGMQAAEAGDVARLRDCVEECEALCARHPLDYAGANVALLRGWVDVLDGRAGAIARITEAIAVWRAGKQPHLTYGLTLLARSHLLAGDVDAGRHAVCEGIEFGLANDDRWIEAELLVVDAELLVLAGDRAGAEMAAQRAIAVALHQEALRPHRRATGLLAACRIDHG
jgi:class 3 adenylate cyclase/DNA-binding SARP family transcriptional activator/tetratricopeptide (TPR) repeat protein